VLVFCINLEKPEVEIFEMPEVEIYRKWICIICVIEISGLMLGSMPEVVERLKTG